MAVLIGRGIPIHSTPWHVTNAHDSAPSSLSGVAMRLDFHGHAFYLFTDALRQIISKGVEFLDVPSNCENL